MKPAVLSPIIETRPTTATICGLALSPGSSQTIGQSDKARGNRKGFQKASSKSKGIRDKMQKPIIGLALGGGAARGWAHIGVLNALHRLGIRPDIIAGTSMGAIAGGCYAAGKLETLSEFAQNLTLRGLLRYLDFNFSGSGILSGGRLRALLKTHLDAFEIEHLPIKFAAVATQIGTGHEVWLTHGKLVRALQASSALPGIFKPVCVNHRWLTDGVLVNPVPVSVCRAFGAEVVIAVTPQAELCGKGGVIPDHGATTQECDSNPPESIKPPKGNGRAAKHLLHRQFLGPKEMPGITSVMVDAFNITQDRIARARLAGDPPDVIIAPRLRDIGLFDFHRAKEIIPQGEAAVERAREDIFHALGMLTETPT